MRYDFHVPFRISIQFSAISLLASINFPQYHTLAGFALNDYIVFPEPQVIAS